MASGILAEQADGLIFRYVPMVSVYQMSATHLGVERYFKLIKYKRSNFPEDCF